MFCKCKPPTQEYSNPNMPLPSLKFFTQKSKSMAHVFSMWPLPNSQDHFLLLLELTTLYSSHSLSLYKYPQMFTSMHDLALPTFCPTQASYHALSTVAIHSLFPNSPNSCHYCYLGQKLSSPYILPSSVLVTLETLHITSSKKPSQITHSYTL